MLRGANERVDFEFPAAVSPDTEMVYRRYEDMDPVEAAAKVTLVEGEQVGHLRASTTACGALVGLACWSLAMLAAVVVVPQEG